MAAERNGVLKKVDPLGKTRLTYFVLIAIGKDGVSLHEYDLDGNLVSDVARATPSFVERYLSRGMKARTGPGRPAVLVHADARPETVTETFAAIGRADTYPGWLTGTLPDSSGKTGVEKTQAGGKIRHEPGRVTYVRQMVDFHVRDAAGRPEPVLYDDRC